MSIIVNNKIRSLSAVIPVFNEEHIIEESLLQLEATLRQICADYEILVVDDGSTDRSPQILQQLMGKIHGLRILTQRKNQGLGSALCYGFSQAERDFIFYIDADMPFRYAEIWPAAELMQASGADIVAGMRVRRQTESLLRRISSAVYNGCILCGYGLSFCDINCAFKLMRTDRVRSLDLKARGSFIDAELILRAYYLGYKIERRLLEYYPRCGGQSRLFRFAPVIKTFVEMIVYCCDIRSQRRPAGKGKC